METKIPHRESGHIRHRSAHDYRPDLEAIQPRGPAFDVSKQAIIITLSEGFLSDKRPGRTSPPRSSAENIEAGYL